MTTVLNVISNYKRTYYITTKVIDQLKDDDDTTSIDARDIMNEIDAAIVTAIAEGNVENIWDRDEPARIVCLDSWFEEAPVYVLLKQDRTNLKGWAAITTVSKAHIEQNRASGLNWVWADVPHPEHFGNKLVKKPKGISIRANALPDNTTTAIAKPMIVLYYKTADGTEHYARVPSDQASYRAAQIINEKAYCKDSLETYSQIKNSLKDKLEIHGF